MRKCLNLLTNWIFLGLTWMEFSAILPFVEFGKRIFFFY
nr:MAG TPA: hypothetical protein [Caudoviricetes sp.]